MRLVIGPEAMRSSEWTLPTTMSSRLSSSGVWSSDPSDRMSTSMPGQDPERRQLGVQLCHVVQLPLQPLRRKPVGDRERR